MSRFSPHYIIGQLLTLSPVQTVIYIYGNVEFNINQDACQYVPWYHVQFRSHCIQQSMNQFSNTQRYLTTAGYVELRWTSISNKLPPTLILHLAEAKCSLSAVAVVCVHSVECAEGAGWIDNSTRRTGLSYLINTVTNRNVWKAYWWNNLANTSSLSLLFFLNFYLSFYLYLQTCRAAICRPKALSRCCS